MATETAATGALASEGVENEYGANYQLSALLLSLGLLFIGLTIFAKFSAYDHDEALTQSDNPAVGWVTFGYLSGLLIVLATILGMDVEHDGQSNVMVYAIELLIYGFLAIVLSVSGVQ